jgi:hypothetical protein
MEIKYKARDRELLADSWLRHRDFKRKLAGGADSL